MLSFLFTISCSYTVDETGYHSVPISSSGVDLKFDLENVSNYDYYIVFLSYLSYIKIDGDYLVSRVYMLHHTSSTYKMTCSNYDSINFGVFLIPKVSDALEFWIYPSTKSYYMTQTSSSSKDYYLIILDSEQFEFTSVSTDGNDIYASDSGGKPDIQVISNRIYSWKCATIHYHQDSYTASTHYQVTASYSSTKSNYQYYDNSHNIFIFSTGISISEFPSPRGSGSSSSSSYSYPSYGYNSITISSSTEYSIPEKTLIVFTKSDSITGNAEVESESLSILGSTGIKAIAFLEEGTLTLSSSSSSKTCDFVVYKYADAYSGCSYVTILSGKVKYKLEPDSNYEYCVVSAFSNGKVKIISTNVLHVSNDPEGVSEYEVTTSNENATNPIITYMVGEESKYNQMEIDVSGSSDDDQFAIDGSNSKYDFYTISSSSSTQVNTYKSIGKASFGGLEPWAIALIVIIVIIVVIVILCIVCCVCCCHKSCCCCSANCCSSSSRVSATNEHNETRPDDRISTSNNNQTRPTQTVSPSNNNSGYPGQVAPPSSNSNQVRPAQTVSPSNNNNPGYPGQVSSSTKINNQVSTSGNNQQTTIQVNVVNTQYYTPQPQPQQQPQQQQTQPNYIPPTPQTPVYVAPPQQPYYGASPQQPVYVVPQPVYGAPPQQPVYGAPPPVYGALPQQPQAYIAPAPVPSYNAPENKDNYYNPYNQ